METSMTVPEIIELHGYSCQELTVTTTDGFQLSVFRVGKPEVTTDETDSEAEINENDVDRGPAVLLQHGLLADAANWVSIQDFKIIFF